MQGFQHSWKTVRHFKLKRPFSSSSCACRRVVVSGLGVVSPLGCQVQSAWSKLLKGEVGVALNTESGYESIPSKVVARVPRGSNTWQLDVNRYATKTELKYLSDNMIYALAAAEEALLDSGWNPCSDIDRQKTGVAIGAGMVDITEIYETSQTFHTKGYKRVSPYFIPKILINLAAGHVSMKYGFQGPNHAVSTACTTGTHAIGDAMRMIRNGDADIMVCGGTDSGISPVALAGFARARALSTGFINSPETSSRPFDKARDGFVAGEGAGIMILEEFEHAKTRGAHIYAEILGYGMSGDAHHITAPREDGLGAQLCMKACLRDASLNPDEVGYVNCHATSTPLGDVIEVKAIKSLFDDHAYKLQVSSCKGAIGHLLGAAGAVESIFTVLAVKNGLIPPSVNIFELDENIDLNVVPNAAQDFSFSKEKRRIALKNSFGFGGTNASLCIGEI